LLRSLSSTEFRWLFYSNCAFFFVVQAQFVTRMFLAWDLTDSESALATIGLAFTIPMILGSLVSGAVTDRIDKKWLMISGQLALISTESVVLGLLVVDKLAFWHLVGLSLINGCAFPFLMPARTAVIFDMVPPAHGANAMALTNSLVSATRIVGPAIMGFVLDFYGVITTYVAAVALHVVALLFLLPIPKYPVHIIGNKSLMRDTLNGYLYVFNQLQLRYLMLFCLIGYAILMPTQSMLVVFSDKVWHTGESGFGLLMSAMGAGGLVGSLWVAWRSEGINKARWMMLGTLAFGVLLIAFSFSPSFALALILFAAANAFMNISTTLNNTLTMSLAEPAMRGRVSGSMGMMFAASQLFIVPMAWSADWFGVVWAVSTGALLMLALALILIFGNSTLRELSAQS
jgi:MFS family permease